MKLGSALFSGVCAALLFGLATSACSSSGDGSSSSSSGSGASTAGHCYAKLDGSECDCVAANDDSNRASTDWRKVSGCSSSTMSKSLSCFADTKVDGTSTTCTCLAIGCDEGDGSRCYCGQGHGPKSTASSCTKYEWYCVRDDNTECYGGNGTFGSACGNDEHNVTSCAKGTLSLAKDAMASCDRLRFVEPAPSGGGGGGSSSGSECSGCHSDSDCHDKCKRCDRTTCSCVSKATC